MLLPKTPLILLAFIAVPSLGFAQSSNNCQIVLQQPLEGFELDQNLRRDLKAQIYASRKELTDVFLYSVNKDVLAGKRTPKWDDFNRLEKFLEELTRSKAKIDGDPARQRVFHSIAGDIRKALLSNPEVVEVFQALRDGAGKRPEVATERDLRVTYWHLLHRVNELLPRELKIPLKKVPFEDRVPRLIVEGEKYLSGLESDFQNRFQAKAGKSVEEFIHELRQSEDPLMQKAFHMIDQGQILPVVRRVETARFWTPKVGFQNQFVTASSQGTNNPAMRNGAEANFYRQENAETYSARDPEFKPKYGTLQVDQASGAASKNSSSKQYGTDFYILKTKNIERRLTWYPTDSLGPARTVSDLPLGSFIPWKYRELMAPFMILDLKSGEFATAYGHSSLSEVMSFSSGRYWEIQILGPLRLSDVEAFEFQNAPPSGEFLRELQKHGIKIRDRRTEPAVDWTPSSEAAK